MTQQKKLVISFLQYFLLESIMYLSTLSSKLLIEISLTSASLIRQIFATFVFLLHLESLLYLPLVDLIPFIFI